MPYKVGSPPDRIKALPKHAQEIWIKAFNNALKQYGGDEERANKVAWSAVEKAGYKKNKDGKWVKSEAVEKFNCECLKCHYKMVSDKHCREIQCPKCGGEMRRAERPGPGQEGKETDTMSIKFADDELHESAEHELIDICSAPCMVEEKDGGFYMRGLFAEADIKNQNNRIYPKAILENAVGKFKESVIIGMDGHPPMFSAGSYRDVALKLENAWLEDNRALCRVKVLDTQAGRDLKIVAQEGIPIGLSMRGYGDEKYDEKLKANVVQENYRLSGIDAVLEPAFEQAKVIREQKEKLNKQGGENMDELNKQITELNEKIVEQEKQIKQLTEAGDSDKKKNEDDAKVLAEVKAMLEKDKEIVEAKKKVAEILESDEYKDHEFKDTIRKQLEKCESVEEVEKVLPKVVDTLSEFKGKKKDAPDPVSVVINEQGFFGDKKVPGSITEAYGWLLDKFKDNGAYSGLSALDNPRYCAKMLIDNYIKLHLSGRNFDALTRGAGAGNDVLRESRRNPLYYLTKKHIQETLGDTEADTGDVSATAGYMLPVYTIVMKDLMEIVNQAVAIQPIDRPAAKIFFGKEYYGDGAGTWSEVSANFSSTQAQKTEGSTPQYIKFAIASDDISLETSLRLIAPFTIDLEQDLKAYHGLNVDAIHIQVMRREIMREISHQILADLLTGSSTTNGDNCIQVTGSPTTFNLTPEAGFSGGEWLKMGLTRAIKQAGALVNKDPWNVRPDTIIADADLEYLFTEPHFVASDAIPTDFGFNRIGTFQNQYKVFTTSMADYNNKILLTHRGSSFMDAAELFLPYVLFYLGPRIDTTTLMASRSCLSRFAIQKVIGKKISIINVE